MNVGDLVRLKSEGNVYGFIVAITNNKWIGSRCAVVWLKNNFPKKWYGYAELEVLSESR
jgi:hypothetical protein